MLARVEKIFLWSIRILTILILFLPLLVYQNTLYPYIFGKVIIFRILVEVMFVFWLFLAIYNKKYRPDWKNPLVLGLTIFIGVLFLTALTGVDFSRSFWSTQERMTGILTLIHCWLWFIILTSVFSFPTSKKDWSRFIWVALTASFLVGFYGIGQKFGWKFFLQSSEMRMNSTLGNPDFLAVYSMVNIFLAGVLAVIEKKTYLRILAIAFLIFNLIIIILTATRAVAVSLSLTLILFLIFLIFIRSKKKSIILIKILAIILLIVIIGGGIFLYTHRTESWMKKAPFIVRRVMSISLKSNQERLDAWKIGIEGFKEKPIFGWGWENYNVVFNKYYKPWYLQKGSQTTWFDRSHNQIIDLLALTGIVGALSYLFVFVAIFYLLFRKKTYQKLISVILAGLFFSYFIQNLFVFDTPAPLIVFYFSLALVYFVSKNQKLDFQKETRFREAADFPLPILIFLIIIFIPWAMYKFNLEPLNQSILAVRAISISKIDLSEGLIAYKKALAKPCFTNAETRLQLTKMAVGIDSKNKNYQPAIALAISEMEKNVKEHPYDVRYSLYLGQLYNLGNYPKKAEEILKKSLKLSPKRQQIYYELVQSKISQGKNSEALELAKRALKLDDKVKDSHWILGVAYLTNKDYKEGLKEIELAYKMRYRYGKNSAIMLYLANAYSQVGNYKKAVLYCNDVLKFDSENIKAMMFKAIYLAKSGDKKGADKVLEDLSKINLSASQALEEELEKIEE